jgi:hypothetical protein
MGYRISPLDRATFEHLFDASDAELARAGAVRMRVDNKPGFPCRLTLADAEIGETVLLVNHEHLAVDSPYRSAHAVFVREHAESAQPVDDTLPESLAIRLLSVRALDERGMMIDADVVHGSEAAPVIERLLDNPAVAYLHLHNAKPGCYAARVDRLA